MQVFLGTDILSVPFAPLWDTDAAVITTLFFFAALAVASVQDIRRKEVDDCIHVAIAAIAFIGFEWDNLPAMLFGAAVSALPLLIAALIDKGRVGGADIKLMAAGGLLLGAGNGIAALISGLFLGVGSTFIYRMIRKADLAPSFPLVPFLSAGCIAAYLL